MQQEDQPHNTTPPKRRQGRIRRIVSVSLDPALLERIERHATRRSGNFSRTVSELIAVGLGACAESARDASTTSSPNRLLEQILDRLKELGGEPVFDTGVGCWKACCPLDPRHFVFLVADIDDYHALDYVRVNLLCAEHPTEELCQALGFKDALDPERLAGHIGGTPILKPDPPITRGRKASS